MVRKELTASSIVISYIYSAYSCQVCQVLETIACINQYFKYKFSIHSYIPDGWNKIRNIGVFSHLFSIAMCWSIHSPSIDLSGASMILTPLNTKSLFVETGVENSSSLLWWNVVGGKTRPSLNFFFFRPLETEGFTKPFKCRPIVRGMGRNSSVSCLLVSKHFRGLGGLEVESRGRSFVESRKGILWWDPPMSKVKQRLRTLCCCNSQFIVIS